MEFVVWVFGVDFVVDVLVEAFAVVDSEVDDGDGIGHETDCGFEADKDEVC